MVGWPRQIGTPSQGEIGKCEYSTHLYFYLMRLLKRTWPISEEDRECDGYKRIMRKSTEEQRQAWGIDTSKLQSIIRAGERYKYEVGFSNSEGFVAFASCFENDAILKKFIDKVEGD